MGLLHMIRSPINVNQRNILANLRTYLSVRERDSELIDGLDYGYCSGVSALWLCSKWTQTKIDKKYGSEWFKHTEELIAGWDGQRLLNDDEVADFERFLSLIEFFPHSKKYFSANVFYGGELHKAMEVIEDEKLEPEYLITSLVTKESLKKLLNSDNFIQNHRLIQISSEFHSIALFKDGDQYCCFDPANETGEIQVASLDEIAEFIFKSNSNAVENPFAGTDSPEKIGVLGLGFSMYAFSTTAEEYPKEKYPVTSELLNEIAGSDFFVNEFSPLVGKSPGAHWSGILASALTLAARHGCVEALKYFLDFELFQRKGFEPDRLDRYGYTAIFYAAERGDVSTVRMLLEYGSNANRVASNGLSPIMLAAMHGHKEVVDIFIKAGVQPDLLTSNRINKKTALVWAARNGQEEVFELLLGCGADPAKNSNGSYNETALMFAAKNGHLAIVKRLLGYQAVVDEINIKSGYDSKEFKVAKTPLMWAAQNGYTEIVKALYEKGASLTEVDADGNDALKLAAKNGRLEVVKLLCDLGVNLRDTNREHKTASELAIENGHKEICDVINGAITRFSSVMSF